MSLVVVLKVIHVVAVIVAVGANVSYAFWLRYAGRDRERLVYTISGIRRLDRLVANPSYVLVLVTGILMVLGGAYSFGTGWIAASIVLYVAVAVLGITAFGPAIRRQPEHGVGPADDRGRPRHRRADGDEAVLIRSGSLDAGLGREYIAVNQTFV